MFDCLQAGSIPIIVTVRDGASHAVFVQPHDVLRALKWKLLDATGIGPEQQHLTFHGQVLDDDVTIADYGIDAGFQMDMEAIPPNVRH